VDERWVQPFFLITKDETFEKFKEELKYKIDKK
jgi:hypothetical protein